MHGARRPARSVSESKSVSFEVSGGAFCAVTTLPPEQATVESGDQLAERRASRPSSYRGGVCLCGAAETRRAAPRLSPAVCNPKNQRRVFHLELGNPIMMRLRLLSVTTNQRLGSPQDGVCVALASQERPQQADRGATGALARRGFPNFFM